MPRGPGVACPFCGKALVWQAALVGQDVTCVGCGSRFALPATPTIPVGPSMPTCQLCGAGMEPASRKTSEGSGCVVFLIGLCLVPVIIGIPILIWGLVLVFKRENFWRCVSCRATHPRS